MARRAFRGSAAPYGRGHRLVHRKRRLPAAGFARAAGGGRLPMALRRSTEQLPRRSCASAVATTSAPSAARGRRVVPYLSCSPSEPKLRHRTRVWPRLPDPVSLQHPPLRPWPYGRRMEICEGALGDTTKLRRPRVDQRPPARWADLAGLRPRVETVTRASAPARDRRRGTSVANVPLLHARPRWSRLLRLPSRRHQLQPSPCLRVEAVVRTAPGRRKPSAILASLSRVLSRGRTAWYEHPANARFPAAAVGRS